MMERSRSGLSLFSRLSAKRDKESSDEKEKDFIVSSPLSARKDSNSGTIRGSSDDVGALASSPPASSRVDSSDEGSLRGSASGSPLSSSSSLLNNSSTIVSSGAAAAATTTTSSSSPQADEGSLVRSPKSRPAREMIAREILSTERTYVESLGFLKAVFETPLRESLSSSAKSVPILEADEVKSIFGHLDPILAYNSIFYEKLRKLIEGDSFDNNATLLGPVFTELSFFLKTYSMYINNFTYASKLIDKLSKKKPRFKELLIAGKNDPRTMSKGIIDFLIMPVQRIPRYSLLLADLLKHTPTDHADYASLEAALAKVNEVATFINDTKAAQDDFVRVNEINKKLIDSSYNLMVGKRKLIREEKACILKRDGPTEESVKMFFFNDCLIFASKTRKALSVRSWLWLQELYPLEKELVSVAPITDLAIKVTEDAERVRERRRAEENGEDGEAILSPRKEVTTFLIASLGSTGMTKARAKVRADALVSDLLAELAERCEFELNSCKLLLKGEAMDVSSQLSQFEGLTPESIVHLVPRQADGVLPKLQVGSAPPTPSKIDLVLESVKDEFKMNPHSSKAEVGQQVLFYIPGLDKDETEYFVDLLQERIAVCRENPVNFQKAGFEKKEVPEDSTVEVRKGSFLSNVLESTLTALTSPNVARRGGSSRSDSAPSINSSNETLSGSPEVKSHRPALRRAPTSDLSGSIPSFIPEPRQVPLVPLGESVEEDVASADVLLDSKLVLKQFVEKSVPKPPARRGSLAVPQRSSGVVKPPPPLPAKKPRASSMIVARSPRGNDDGEEPQETKVSDSANLIAMLKMAEEDVSDSASPSSSSPLVVPRKPGVGIKKGVKAGKMFVKGPPPKKVPAKKMPIDRGPVPKLEPKKEDVAGEVVEEEEEVAVVVAELGEEISVAEPVVIEEQPKPLPAPSPSTPKIPKRVSLPPPPPGVRRSVEAEDSSGQVGKRVIPPPPPPGKRK